MSKKNNLKNKQASNGGLTLIKPVPSQAPVLSKDIEGYIKIDYPGQAEMAVHMLNWAIRSVKFLGVEFDQSEDEEVSVSDTTHL